MTDNAITRIVVLPPPPRPQSEFSFDFSNQLNRWLTQLQAIVQGIVYLRGSGLYLSPDSFPTTGYGLAPGEVFANNGILTWVREGDIWIGSLPISASLGTVTVS